MRVRVDRSFWTVNPEPDPKPHRAVQTPPIDLDRAVSMANGDYEFVSQLLQAFPNPNPNSNPNPNP